MTLTELASCLEREGFNPRWYSFDHRYPPSEGFVLEKVSGRWKISFYERGMFREIARFESERDACVFFHARMVEEFGASRGRTKH